MSFPKRLQPMQSFIFMLVCFLVIPACTNEQAVENTLKAVAPENPNRLARAIEVPDQVEENETESETRDDQEQQNQQQSEREQPAILTIRVHGLSSCRFGAVRCLINRKYTGAINDEGSLTIELPAGYYEGELVDSAGQWFFTVNLQPGQSAQLNFTCSDKILFGVEQLDDEAGQN